MLADAKLPRLAYKGRIFMGTVGVDLAQQILETLLDGKSMPWVFGWASLSIMHGDLGLPIGR
jgi:hypothetical protein